MSDTKTIRNVVLFSELQDILTSLQNTGHMVILLKGAALSEIIYPNISIRSMDDIDILVKTNELQDICKLLISNGYEQYKKDEYNLSPNAYVKTGKVPIIIDLHTRLKHLDRVQNNDIWQNTLPVKIANIDTLILTPEYNIIHIICHLLISHGHINQKWLQDIDLIVRHYKGLDWIKIIKILDNNNIKTLSIYLLEKVKEDFNTPIPNKIIYAASRDTFKKKLFKIIFYREKPIPFIKYVLPVFMRSGIKEKIIFILKHLFPPKEYISKRFNTKSPFFYLFFYILRIFDILLKGLLGLIGMLINIFANLFKR